MLRELREIEKQTTKNTNHTKLKTASRNDLIKRLINHAVQNLLLVTSATCLVMTSCQKIHPQIAHAPEAYTVKIDTHGPSEAWDRIYNIRIDENRSRVSNAIVLSGQLQPEHSLNGFFNVRATANGVLAKEAFWRVNTNDEHIIFAVVLPDDHVTVTTTQFSVEFANQRDKKPQPVFCVTGTR